MLGTTTGEHLLFCGPLRLISSERVGRPPGFKAEVVQPLAMHPERPQVRRENRWHTAQQRVADERSIAPMWEGRQRTGVGHDLLDAADPEATQDEAIRAELARGIEEARCRASK